MEVFHARVCYSQPPFCLPMPLNISFTLFSPSLEIGLTCFYLHGTWHVFAGSFTGSFPNSWGFLTVSLGPWGPFTF